MSHTLTIDEVPTKLAALLEQLGPEDQIELTDAAKKRIARIVPEPEQRRVFGVCKDMIKVVSDDDEHLADFKDYL